MADRKDDARETPDQPPGKVAHDQRGNAVWQWAGSATKQALDSTSRMLKKLEVLGLSLLEDPKPSDAKSADTEQTLKAQRAAGFNPYEGAPDPPKSRAPVAPPRASPPSVPWAPARPASPPIAPASKPSLVGPALRQGPQAIGGATIPVV